MIIFDEIAFHNVYELAKEGELPGWVMHRFSQTARESINLDAADLSRSVELRFCLNKPACSMDPVIYLMARGMDGEATVYYGDYQQFETIPLPKGVIAPVTIRNKTAIDTLPAGRFANHVVRVVISSRSAVSYVGKEWLSCRPPLAQELPCRLLAGHGSSITHGGLAGSNCNCFIQLAARALGMDCLNLGTSGSCMATPEVADFLAEEVEADVYFLELGANMHEAGMTPDEYRKRVRYTLRRVAQAHSHQPVYAMALFPGTYGLKRTSDYSIILHELVEEQKLPNLFELHGWDLMPGFDGLTTDGVHPSDWGHMVIAANLSVRMRQDEREGKWKL